MGDHSHMWTPIQPRTQGCFINNPGTGHEVLDSDWPIKTHNPRSKILESRQINITNTNFRAFRQSNQRRIIIARKIAFQEVLMLRKKYT